MDPNSNDSYSQQYMNDLQSMQTPVPLWRRIVDVPVRYGPATIKFIYQGLWSIVWRWWR